jgi:hypothetical protein
MIPRPEFHPLQAVEIAWTWAIQRGAMIADREDVERRTLIPHWRNDT